MHRFAKKRKSQTRRVVWDGGVPIGFPNVKGRGDPFDAPASGLAQDDNVGAAAFRLGSRMWAGKETVGEAQMQN